jgi:hypothetical protein
MTTTTTSVLDAKAALEADESPKRPQRKRQIAPRI